MKLEGHTDTVRSVCFSPDARTIASGSWDKSIRLWDVKSGKLIFTLEGHTFRVWSVCFSPDGQTVASCSEDRSIRLWDISSGKEI